VLVGVNTEDSSQAARVARNSVAPIILNLFNRGIDFAFLLVMLRVLPPEQVGIYYYLVILFEWFDIMTNFGLDLFLTREVARDKSKAALYFINGTLLRLVLAVVGIGLVLGVVFVRQATVDPALDSSALLALALLYVGLFPASLSKGMTSVFYAFEQAEKPAAIATITSINKAIFGVMALLLGYGIVGLAGVSIINNLITFGVLLYTGRHLLDKLLDYRPKLSLLKEMVYEGFPLMLNHFLATIFFKIDVVLLEALRGAGVVARYSIAYKWILAINIIPSFFTQALLPVMSRQAQEDRGALRRNYQFGIKLLVALAMPLAVIFTAVATPLTLFTGGAPYLPDGAIAIQLMIWSIPIGWMNSLTQYVLVAMDLQRQITRAFVLAVGFNLITNALLIPQYGYQAAALTTIASELVLFVPFAVLTQRGFGERIEWVSLLWRPALATLAMIAVTIAGAQVHLLVGVFAGSVVYAGVLLALKPLTQRELTRLQSLLPERALRIPFLKPSQQAVPGD
jgi:O-antigen/teichoic acid export membrane protein